MDSTTGEVNNLNFNLLGYEVNHFDRKDLVSLSIKINSNEYEVSFLIDDYNSVFFPEFKNIDKYASSGVFKIIHEFLMSIRAKVQYFLKMHSYNNSKNKKINDWDPEKEWWQKEQTANDLAQELKLWVTDNIKYLMEFDFSNFKTKEMIDELSKYLDARTELKRPIFNFNSGVNETLNLEQQLKNAIEKEDYEQAVILREKIKNKL